MNADNILMIAILFLTMFALFVNMSLYYVLYIKYRAYNDESMKFQKVAQLRIQNLSDINASKAAKGETYVVVIGESQNRHHMGLYGYFRDTTPKLQMQNLLQLKYPYSNQVYTTAVLSYALTQANALNHIDYFKAYSIVDIVQRAGFKTYWLTNQVLKGGWDNVISVIANRCDTLVGLNKGFGKTVSTSHYDADLLPYLKKALAEKTKQNKIIFIHLMGNHNRYSDRYPKAFDKYNRYLQYDAMGNIVDTEGITDFINSYDNSMLYNDFVLSEIITAMKNQKGALLYFADHSEGVDYKLAHTPDDFRYEMCDIPVMLYLTEKYKKAYPQKVKNLQKNKDKLFNNAFVYDTLIGLMNIKTENFETKYDLSSEKYLLKENEAYTLHGKKLYTSAENYEYQKEKNVEILQQKGIDFSVKNYESFAQIYEAFTKGASSITLTLYEHNAKGYIKNSSEHLLSFKQLVLFMKNKDITLPLYIKFASKSTQAFVSKIVQEYPDIHIIVSKNKIEKFRTFKHVVLALDNSAIVKSIFALDKKALEKLAYDYIKLMKKYKIKELYFQDTSMQFVKKYLKNSAIQSYLIDTNKNICDKKIEFDILNGENNKKNIVFDLNYCTIFAQDKKYKSMGI